LTNSSTQDSALRLARKPKIGRGNVGCVEAARPYGAGLRDAGAIKYAKMSYDELQGEKRITLSRDVPHVASKFRINRFFWV
jgi:hypothetical protein